MKIYKCKKCGEKIETDESSYFVCPNCGYEENIESEELENIIDSFVENILTDNEEERKIINKDLSKNCLEISNNNPIITINREKCNNCGKCKKICENIVGLKYVVYMAKHKGEEEGGTIGAKILYFAGIKLVPIWKRLW